MNRRLTPTLVAAAGALALAGPAHACLPGAGTPVFAKWGDDHRYNLLSRVDLKDARAWALSGGAKVQGDDAPATGDATDRLSIELPPRGEAWSPAVCAGSEFAAFRFFARTADLLSRGSGGFVVEAILENGHVTTYPTITAPPSWAATSRLQGSLGNWFKTHDIGAVRLRFRNTSTHIYRVDDIYYDAHSSKDS